MTPPPGAPDDDQDRDEAPVLPGKPNLSRFDVEGVIIHEIPARPSQFDRKAGKEDSTPSVSDIESELTPEFRAYIENRIKSSLALAAFPVSVVDGTQAVVPGLVAEVLGHRSDADHPPPKFVAASQEMARSLHDHQTANSPAGLFAVVRGRWDDKPFVAALKLEREAGLRVEADTIGTARTFKVIVERQLVMTENTKVFKTGIFRPLDGRRKVPELEGWVSDQQTGFGASGKIVANFFIEFLGCALVDRPDVQTKRFFDVSERFFNREVDEPVQRSKYLRALIADLASNKKSVRPPAFADEHLEGADRQGLIDALTTGGAPTSTFRKDTSLIDARLDEVSIRFKSGIDVRIARAHFDSGRASIEKDPEEEDSMVLTVRGRVDYIAGR